MVLIIPSILVLCSWPLILDGFQSLYKKKWALFSQNFILSLNYTLLICIGFACAFAPHIFKNIMFHGSLIGAQDSGSFYSTATIVKIILSYPFALTFGRYWAQFGTLSPLFLAFAPLILILPKSSLLKDSKFAAVGISTLIGLIFWIALFPSYFMPRYFLATLFMLSISFAAGADIISRQRSFIAKIIPVAVFVTLISTPSYTNNYLIKTGYFKTFHKIEINRLFLNNEKSFLYSEDITYSLSHKAINASADQGDRVLLFTYYRLWLRSDLLQKVSTSEELGLAINSGDKLWNFVREKKFRFILWDKNIFQLNPALFNSPPKDIQLKEIYRDPSLVAYKVILK